MTTRITVCILSLALLTVVGCSEDTSVDGLSPDIEQTLPENATTPAAETQADASLEMSNYKYSSETLTARAGSTIALSTLEGTHDFVIDDPNLSIQSEVVGAGDQPQTITIPEDTPPGEYTFYCSLGRHREFGMEGTLIVE